MTATPPPTTLSPASSTELPLYAAEDRTTSSSTKETSSQDMSQLRPLYLIVATSLRPSLGIGFNGTLPWPSIRADMNFFQKVTRDARPSMSSSTAPEGSTPRVNAVTMGRKTYESIPPRFRPLAGRVNVVVTRSSAAEVARGVERDVAAKIQDRGTSRMEVLASGSGSESEGDVLIVHHDSTSEDDIKGIKPTIIANSLDAAIKALSDGRISRWMNDAKVGELSDVFVIGGAEIYKQTLELAKGQGRTTRILQTLIKKDQDGEIDCDTFFPVKLGEEGEKRVEGAELKIWLRTVDGEIPLPQKDEEWCKDQKSGFEVKVLGWER